MSGYNDIFSYGVQYLVCECGEALQDEDSLRVHLVQKHPQRRLKLLSVGTKKAPPPITEFRCGECGNIYSTEEACVEHQETEHIPYMEEDVYQEVEEDIEDAIIPDVIFQTRSSETSSPPPPEPPKRKKKRNNRRDLQCETCGKKCTSNTILWYHRKRHAGVKAHKCPYCPKAFTLQMYLEQHIRTHTGEKPYQCQKCPKAFCTKGNLLRHDLVHSGLKPYQCPACGNTFKQSNSLKLHYHTVHLRLPAPYLSRARRARRDAGEAQVQSSHPYTHSDIKPDPDKVYIVKTAAGREIVLSTLVPKKMQQQALLQAKLEEPKTEQPEIKEEEFYYDDGEGSEENVAYEVEYE